MVLQEVDPKQTTAQKPFKNPGRGASGVLGATNTAAPESGAVLQEVDPKQTTAQKPFKNPGRGASGVLGATNTAAPESGAVLLVCWHTRSIASNEIFGFDDHRS